MTLLAAAEGRVTPNRLVNGDYGSTGYSATSDRTPLWALIISAWASELFAILEKF